MRYFLITILFLTTQAFANLDRLNIQNLNLNYVNPLGHGDVEKINIGFSSKSEQPAVGPYPVVLTRTAKDFEIKSEFIDITWLAPWTFVHDLERIGVTKGNATFGKRDHSATIEKAVFTPKGQGAFHLHKITAQCNGKSLEMRVENRLLDDCREKLEVKVAGLNVPIDFFMNEIVAQYPQEPMSVDERPLDNLKLTSYKGDFSLVVFTRVVFYAGLRAWGHVSYENDYHTIVIRLDQVKFGYIPITTIVLRELRKRITSPDVTITGNVIRVNVHL